MNWSRGFFRLWVIGSAMWALFWGGFWINEWNLSQRTSTYDVTDPSGLKYEVTTPFGYGAVFASNFVRNSDAAKDRQGACLREPGPWCNYPLKLQTPFKTINFLPLVLLVISAPAIVFAFGLSIRWVLTGFWQNRSSQRPSG